MDRQKIERSIKGLSEWQMHVQAESDIDTNISTAIEALKAQLSKEGTTKGTTSDLISRTETVEHLRRILEATVPNTDYDEGFVDGIEFGISTVSTMPIIQPQSTDLIDRQAARHALCKAVHKGEDIPCENQTASCLWTGTRVCDFVREIDALPSVQPEPAIPLSWIENKIKWLKSLDNTFSEITALQISAMVKKWRDEQDETN